MAGSPHGINYSAHRPVVMGRNGVVSSSHYLASQAGLSTLQAGGNAVDAAIATAATLNVVEPEMSGIGGDGFMLIYMAETGKVEALNGTGAAPLAASIDRYRDTGIPPKGQGPQTSVLRISTPGILDAWLTAHGRYGKLPLAQVFAPAVELASEGFPVSHRLANTLRGEQTILDDHPETARTFLPKGRAPLGGELSRQRKPGKDAPENRRRGKRGLLRVARLARPSFAPARSLAGCSRTGTSSSTAVPDGTSRLPLPIEDYRCTSIPPTLQASFCSRCSTSWSGSTCPRWTATPLNSYT